MLIPKIPALFLTRPPELQMPVSSGVTNPIFSKKQIYPNSCGAVSLLCVAKELGVKTLPPYPGSLSEQLGLDSLEMDNRCESDIYTITSGASTHRHQQHNLMLAGYSMPEHIVTAGRLLGLKMTVEEDPGVFSRLLAWLYPEIKQTLSGIGCPLVKGPEKIEDYQRKIEVMAVSLVGVPSGLHWVVHRNDGSYMDPATGENYNNFDQLNAGAKRSVSQMLGYYQTGISIVATAHLQATGQHQVHP